MDGMFDDLIPRQGQQNISPKGGDMFADLVPETGAKQAKSLTQSATERLRYINDVMTFGGWDRLQALARSTLGSTPYQQALTEERAATEAARGSLSIPEQIGYGVIGAVPLAAAGGLLGLGGRALTAGGATRAGGALTEAATVAAPTLVQRAGIGAAEVGLQGALEAALKDQNISTGATTGMAVGAGVPVALSGLGRVISPIRSQLTEPQKKLAQEAADRGIELTPGQATGSRATQFFESQLRDLPGGGMSPRIQQQEQLQKLALREAGIESKYATAEAIEGAFKRTGQEFDRILTGKTVNLGDEFGNTISDAVLKYGNRLDASIKPVFQAQAEGLLREPNLISGIRASNIRSDLASLERQYKSQPALVAAIGQLREAVDNSIARALTGAEKEAMTSARNQYKNLFRIDEVMSRAGPQAESGMIPFVQLNNLIKQREGSISRGISSASPEFKKLSQIGSTFFREPPSSGTSQRNYITSLLTGGGFLAGGLPGVATTVGVPLATNVVYNLSPMQRLLSQQAGRALETMPPQIATGIGQVGVGLLGQ